MILPALMEKDRTLPEPEFRAAFAAMWQMAALAQMREEALADANKRLRALGAAPVELQQGERAAQEPAPASQPAPERPTLALLNARVDLPPTLYAVVLPTDPPSYAAVFGDGHESAVEWAARRYRGFAVFDLMTGEQVAGRAMALQPL